MKIICEIYVLNYLFHLMFWPDKDQKTFNNLTRMAKFPKVLLLVS